MDALIDWIADVDLLKPIMGAWLVGISVLCLLILAWPNRRKPIRLLVATVLVGALTVGTWYFCEKVWKGLPVPMSKTVYGWTGVALGALTLAIIGGRRIARFLLVLVVVICAALGANLSMKPFATIGDLWGAHLPPTRTFDPPTDQPSQSASSSPTAWPDGPIETWYTPPANLPTKGTVVTAEIPATKSGITPRTANIYLPPAYGLEGTPPLPVIMMLHGIPGDPTNWLTQVPAAFDDYAAQHKGLAPIVVMPESTGGADLNLLCSDTPKGKLATYLQGDVPDWINANLKVDTRHTRWAVGGLSYGGTCALQIVTRDPSLFPIFLDLSGELAPSLGTEERTINEGFGGDVSLYRANNPIDLMKASKYPGVTGWFVSGASDPGAKDLHTVYEAAQKAGMTVAFDNSLPGSHDWQFWGLALRTYLPILGSHLGITA